MSELTDHDLLITIATKIDTFMGSIRDHERRLRRLELSVLGFIGGAVVILSKSLNIF